jgi:hypothetical protein
VVLSVGQARKKLGTASGKYSDKQLEEVIRIFSVIADLAIDSFVEKQRLREEVNFPLGIPKKHTAGLSISHRKENEIRED